MGKSPCVAGSTASFGVLATWGGMGWASKQAIFTLLERKEVGIGQNLERIWANEGYSLPGEVTGKGMGVASFDGYDLDHEGDMRG